MGRYTGPKWKQSRREGVELRDNGKRALTKRNYPPGIHGPMFFRKRVSSYGKQLREKQKAKRIYGLYERQFKNLYNKAVQIEGNASINLRQLLELRLDNAVYRLGWATSRPQARQLINHGHIQINEKKVDIPSYQVKSGMTISIKPSYLKKTYWQEILPKAKKQDTPSWLKAEDDKAIVTGAPDVEELGTLFDPTLIIEYYSK